MESGSNVTPSIPHCPFTLLGAGEIDGKIQTDFPVCLLFVYYQICCLVFFTSLTYCLVIIT